MTGPSSETGPGFWAFVAFFFMAIMLWIILRSMLARLRRIRLAEQAERDRTRAATVEQARRSVSAPLRDRSEERQRGRDEVGREGEDGEGVEDLVEPEPPR